MGPIIYFVEGRSLSRHKRRLEEDHEHVLKSNDELFGEAQRLNDEESIWIEDKETLDSELKHLR